MVAVGAATFKPVVVGTVSHVIRDEDKSLGFGIFYMMVNIGGFAGPIVAGLVRNDLGWPWVFRMSAIWIAVNFIWLAFYKEPKGRTEGLQAELAEAARKLAEKGHEAPAAAGPSQLPIAAARLLPSLIVAGFLVGWIPAAATLGAVVVLALLIKLLFAVVPDEVKLLLRKTGEDIVEVLGNGAFFISAMGSIFICMIWGGGWMAASTMGILIAVLVAGNVLVDVVLKGRGGEPAGLWQPARLGDWRFALYLLILSGFWTEFNQLFITLPEYIRDYTDTRDILNSVHTFFGWFGAGDWWIHSVVPSITRAEGVNPVLNVNPEFLINIDAGAIVLFQVLVSWAFARWKPFTTMIVGTILTGIGMGMNIYGDMGWIVCLAIFEMMASPKSQEYVARIAPPAKTAMYMGYYFVSVALGNLGGGILSGKMYEHYGPRGVNDPREMWLIFGLIGLGTAGILYLYDRIVIRRRPTGESA